MRSSKNTKILIPAALGIIVLILDSGTAIEGAQAGLEVCLRTVLPSLFPFIFLSSILTSSLLSGSLKSSRTLCRLYRIPEGADGILLTGLLGGYPVGAKCIADAVSTGRLPQADAQRMLVFSNAAGPAFLFGVTASVFSQRWIPWGLWAIHLFSGFCIARLLPARPGRFIQKAEPSDLKIAQRLRQSVQVMGDICGWIVLMRIVIALAEQWLIGYLPAPWRILISGILELSNGCVTLPEVENTGLRFIICSVILGFGGLCVALQTGSAASHVSQRLYLPGKCLQALISFLIAYTVQYFVFYDDKKICPTWVFLLSLLAFAAILIYLRIKCKKSCGILEQVGV